MSDAPGPLSAYEALVKSGELRPDADQSQAALRLQALYERLNPRLLEAARPKRGLARFFSRRRTQEDEEASAGLYLHGPAGRGKTRLMDLFYDALPGGMKRREHFHTFMAWVHRRIHNWRLERGPDADDPIPALAAELAQDLRLLAFDEFAITNLADALVLGRLVQAMHDQDIQLVLTSNYAPLDLYPQGLQRARFEPYMAWMAENLEVIEVVGTRDFRRLAQDLGTSWFSPLGPEAKAALNTAFLRFSKGEPPTPTQLNVGTRSLVVPCAAKPVALFHFTELCGQPRGAEDFAILIEAYPILLLSNVPILGRDRRDEALRFQTLVDVLYDRQALLVLSADVNQPEKLFPGQDGISFQRTVSRLIEMRGEDYRRQALERRGLFTPSGRLSDPPQAAE